MAALDDALERDRHVVAEVVEAELGVRAVGDVGLVGGLALASRAACSVSMYATVMPSRS